MRWGPYLELREGFLKKIKTFHSPFKRTFYKIETNKLVGTLTSEE